MKKIAIILIIILIAISLIIITTKDYNLTKKNDSIAFVQTITGWMVRVAENSANLVGNAIKMDWKP